MGTTPGWNTTTNSYDPYTDYWKTPVKAETVPMKLMAGGTPSIGVEKDIPTQAHIVSTMQSLLPKTGTTKYNSLGQEIDENGNVVRDPITGLAKMDPNYKGVGIVSNSTTPTTGVTKYNSAGQQIDASGNIVRDPIIGTPIMDPNYRDIPIVSMSTLLPSTGVETSYPAPDIPISYNGSTSFDPTVVAPANPATGVDVNVPNIKTDPTDTSVNNIPYATFENLQSYFNPMKDALIGAGTRAIQNSAAGKGMLNSSGTVEDIGDWAVRAEGQAYDSAVQNFMADRLGVNNIFNANRDFDWTNYKYQTDMSLGAYGAEDTDYQQKLKDFYDQMTGLSKTGQDAAQNAGNITTDSATAMANLFMALAQMQGQSGVASAQNQSNFMGDLFKMIPSLMSMFSSGSGSSSSSSGG